MPNILLVDDHAIVRKGLRSILESADQSITVEEAADGEQALERVRAHPPPDAVVLDIGLPGRNGIEVLKRLKAEYPKLRVLMLSVHPAEQYGLRVLKAGALGYLDKSAAPEKLVEAVERVLRGHPYVSEELAGKLVNHLTGQQRHEHNLLSDREYQIFLMIASGIMPARIAAALSLSVKTVQTHRSRILAKMGMKSNAELVRYALEHKLLD